MAQHGSLLPSLLFVTSVRELAVICALGEAEMWSAFLVEHSVASWGTLLQYSSTGESRDVAYRERAALWVWFWLFLRFFWVLFIANHLNSTSFGLTVSYL